MATTDFMTYGVGAIVALGGVFGYMKAGSLMSLGMGLAFGSIILYGGHLTSMDRRNFLVPFLASLVLTGVMGARFVNSGKFMPAGLVAGLNLFQVLRFGYRCVAE